MWGSELAYLHFYFVLLFYFRLSQTSNVFKEQQRHECFFPFCQASFKGTDVEHNLEKLLFLTNAWQLLFFWHAGEANILISSSFFRLCICVTEHWQSNVRGFTSNSTWCRIPGRPADKYKPQRMMGDSNTHVKTCRLSRNHFSDVEKATLGQIQSSLPTEFAVKVNRKEWVYEAELQFDCFHEMKTFFLLSTEALLFRHKVCSTPDIWVSHSLFFSRDMTLKNLCFRRAGLFIFLFYSPAEMYSCT